MERLPAVLSVLLLASVAAVGCLGGGDEGKASEVVIEFVVHPPDESVENRSDIDDFQTLAVMVESTQIYPSEANARHREEPRKTFDWTEVVDEGPRTVTTYPVDPGRFRKFTITLGVVEALHENGSRPTIHTAPSGIYVKSYPEDGYNPRVDAGETMRFRWILAVTQDDEDIENSQVPEGEYFLRRLVPAGPV